MLITNHPLQLTGRGRVWTRSAVVFASLGVLLGPSLGCAPAPAPVHGKGTASAGAAGLGDSYRPSAGNGGYDVAHYDVVVRADLDPARLTYGRTTLLATATQGLSSFNLDSSLMVGSVTVDGTPAAFVQQGSELVVTPSRPIPAGEEFTADVTYRSGGEPEGWYTTPREILATGQPEVAEWWFPSNDHPQDAALYDVRIEVPEGRQAVSVGRLVSQRALGGRTTWHWRAVEPMQTYAAFFAAGEFDMSTETVHGVRYTYPVSQQLPRAERASTMRLLKLTPGMIAAMEQDYGPYPYADGGGLVTTTFTNEDWAMENQTRPTYPPFGEDRPARKLMAHEIGHLWFGDWVRPHRWRDIVNNEAFARWSEMRWDERNGGAHADDQLNTMWADHPADGDFWKLQIDDPGSDHLFDLAVYDRGAMMVQALRNRLGEEAFFQVLRRWVTTFGGRTATVGGLEIVAQQASGQDLTEFFTVWLREPRRPSGTTTNGFNFR